MATRYALFSHDLYGCLIAWHLIQGHELPMEVRVDRESGCQFSPVRWVPLHLIADRLHPAHPSPGLKTGAKSVGKVRFPRLDDEGHKMPVENKQRAITFVRSEISMLSEQSDDGERRAFLNRAMGANAVIQVAGLTSTDEFMELGKEIDEANEKACKQVLAALGKE
ncbi:hypothetical protein [Pseudomonas sp.]|uniref:hypothetical protein n=1 Tax=Pseudomonas sp. TaxID=306 RepID=UPI0029152BA8|nr:hypothetical protein [Pseudomonas sp.]MDU4254554.1 hypothetical protein [Pseudomonas sp.]